MKLLLIIRNLRTSAMLTAPHNDRMAHDHRSLIVICLFRRFVPNNGMTSLRLTFLPQSMIQMRGYHFIISLRITEDTQESQAFTPKHIFQHLPRSKSSRIVSLHSRDKSDHRFGPLRIDWMDFEIDGATDRRPFGKEKQSKRGNNRKKNVQVFIKLLNIFRSCGGDVCF